MSYGRCCCVQIPPPLTPQTPSNDYTQQHQAVDATNDTAVIMAMIARFINVSAGSGVVAAAAAGMVGPHDISYMY